MASCGADLTARRPSGPSLWLSVVQVLPTRHPPPEIVHDMVAACLGHRAGRVTPSPWDCLPALSAQHCPPSTVRPALSASPSGRYASVEAILGCL